MTEHDEKVHNHEYDSFSNSDPDDVDGQTLLVGDWIEEGVRIKVFNNMLEKSQLVAEKTICRRLAVM